ncbi:hypothetical protein [Spiroplasma ixodetis]|uniref:hypothetical protein n=1 Tax=Spiroplasma ixodetis TaxID=2141 RepID=UPI0025772AF5|nr:hypothetical protein [Spiroplasma ixodetis]WJG69447.1 hypothetical protein SIXOD_v1c03140 [Spiroplasma ixodetis Y32]WJG69473.1 hypothetical protein SIXOD_v1c03400 [Spiroplasma ixodetis Y32]WJG69881.1 hypothetical protein SIXOD_v1c08680 [Spiroplasma ixodetis Y32]WJG70304.1 hypothetical protein SIXOD_v1c14030 [Spiroplasma ixodetis Y32]WJG70976.1 hypothetical protein SIXOD_v1c22780 [Spiroplasma ixodetis Y32]
MNKEKLLEYLKYEWEWTKKTRYDVKLNNEVIRTHFNGRLNFISELNEKIRNGEFD